MVIEVSSRAIRFNPTVGVIKLFWIRSQDSVLEYNIFCYVAYFCSIFEPYGLDNLNEPSGQTSLTGKTSILGH
jgi:hypothetical protein